MIRALASLALSLALVTGAAAQQKQRVVNVYNWSDYGDPKGLEAFTKEPGTHDGDAPPPRPRPGCRRAAEAARRQRLQLVGLRRSEGARGLHQGDRHQGRLRHL